MNIYESLKEELMLTDKELAKLLGVTPSHFYKLKTTNSKSRRAHAKLLMMIDKDTLKEYRLSL